MKRVRRCLAVLAGLMCCSGGSALAAETHVFEAPPFGAFTSPQAVASDTAGSVYVFDPGAATVSKFSATGEQLELAPGVLTIEGLSGSGNGENEMAIDNSGGPNAGDIYVANNSAVHIYDPAGTQVGELTGGEFCGVAIDPAGNVYVGSYPSTVNKYTPAGAPPTNGDLVASMTGGALSGICNIAVDSFGDVYAATYSGGVNKFDASQFGAESPIGTSVSATGSTLAVDAADDLFVDEGNRFAQYDSAGEQVGTFAGPAGEPFSGSNGIAVSASGQVYVDDNSRGRLDRFGPLVTVPDATSAAPSGVQPTSALLEGSVDPDGTSTTYQFEYGTDTTYGSVLPPAPVEAGAGTGSLAVSALATGLSPETIYHYRLAATNLNGTTYSEDQAFTTLGPAASIAEATEVSSAGATLAGYADVRGLPDARYRFSVTSSTSAFSRTTAEAAVPTGNGAVPVSATIGGLSAGQTYRFRLIVSVGGLTAQSEAGSFQTPPSALYQAPSVYTIAPNPYGCARPVLDAYAARPHAGQTITITGSDLGVAGELTLGGTHPAVSAYTSSSFALTLPANITGSVPLTLNCGHVANTIYLTIAPPLAAATGALSSVKPSVRGSAATLRVAVSANGTISARGANVSATSARAKGKSTVTLKVRLTKAGRRALARAPRHRLVVKLTITYTPSGAKAKSTRVALTFRRS